MLPLNNTTITLTPSSSLTTADELAQPLPECLCSTILLTLHGSHHTDKSPSIPNGTALTYNIKHQVHQVKSPKTFFLTQNLLNVTEGVQTRCFTRNTQLSVRTQCGQFLSPFYDCLLLSRIGSRRFEKSPISAKFF